MENKEKFMARAIELAKLGEGRTNPNPMVGAVIVKNGKILSEGYHAKYGEYHAERNAILSAKQDLQGADIYVNLEPCSHFGKTPPCADLIIEKKFKNVYIGILDPNPLVAGRGVEKLRNAGINVEIGILKEQCEKLNEVFLHFIKTKTPYVAHKFAMSLDGKTATKTGNSKWITGGSSLEKVHSLRNKYQAICVGIGTALADDPMLSCRHENGNDPIRIVCDSTFKIPLGSKIVQTAKEIRTIVVGTSENVENQKLLENMGCEILCVGAKQNGIDTAEMLKKLGEMKIDSILLEGGGNLASSFVDNNLIQKIYCFVAPKIVGGQMAKTPVDGVGIEFMSQAKECNLQSITQYGEDVLLEYGVKKCSQE